MSQAIVPGSLSTLGRPKGRPLLVSDLVASAEGYAVSMSTTLMTDTSLFYELDVTLLCRIVPLAQIFMRFGWDMQRNLPPER